MYTYCTIDFIDHEGRKDKEKYMLGSVGGNVLGTLYFVYFQIAGILVMTRLLKKEGTLTKFLLGSVLGSVLLQWLPVLFAFVF